MERVKSSTEYTELVNEARLAHKPVITNCYLYIDAVDRLIAQNRFYYEKTAGGILFFSDEVYYYQTYYYLNPARELHLLPQDKPLLIQNLYVAGKKNARLSALETSLSANGFVLEDRMEQITADPQTIHDKVKGSCRIAKRFLSQFGFSMIPANAQLIPEIRDMQLNIAEIPVHQVVYFTDEELLEEAQAGHLMAIVDREGALCAVRQFFLEGNGIYGWVAVKPQYKDQYGMALAFTDYSVNFALEHGHKVMGWITDTNQPSIQYHKKIGYQWTGRVMDEWILPAGTV